MLTLLSEAFWFFLPAVMANQCPGLAAKFNLPGNRPVSVRWLGENKTWAAYYAAALAAVATIYLERLIAPQALRLFDYDRPDLWLVGAAFGLGTVLGDHAESFVKRRIGKKPGEPWRPFDQLDYVAGSLLLTAPLTGWIGWERAAIICIVVFALTPLVNGIGFLLTLRRRVW